MFLSSPFYARARKTEEYRKGDPRDKGDSEALKRLLGNKKDFVELHERWLIEKHRGKNYGNKFRFL